MPRSHSRLRTCFPPAVVLLAATACWHPLSAQAGTLEGKFPLDLLTKKPTHISEIDVILRVSTPKTEYLVAGADYVVVHGWCRASGNPFATAKDREAFADDLEKAIRELRGLPGSTHVAITLGIFPRVPEGEERPTSSFDLETHPGPLLGLLTAYQKSGLAFSIDSKSGKFKLSSRTSDGKGAGSAAAGSAAAAPPHPAPPGGPKG